MSYDIHYTKGSFVDRRKSIIDAIQYDKDSVREFLMLVRYGTLITDWDRARTFLAFRGIRGFPAQALWVYASGRDEEKLFPQD